MCASLRAVEVVPLHHEAHGFLLSNLHRTLTPIHKDL